MEPWHLDDQATIYHGDCLEVLRELPDASVDSVVTDPPYGLEFMGKDWDAPWKGDARAASATTVQADAIGGFQDGSGGNAFSRSRVRTDTRRHGGDMLTANHGFQSWCEDWAAECLRVLKPGGHLLAFGGTRTWHRLAVAIEDAGFEIRDSIAWMYGSGFPKSLDVSKAIDKRGGAVAGFEAFRDAVRAAMQRNGVSRAELTKALGNHMLSHYLTAGSQPAVPNVKDYRIIRDTVGLGHDWDHLFAEEAEREVLGERDVPVGHAFAGETFGGDSSNKVVDITAPATPDAARWQGWGTALKPAHEPVVVARKPLTGTVAANVLEHGTGALNIDGCRVGYASDADKSKALAGDAFKRKDTSDKGWSRPWMEDPERVAQMNREAKERAQAGRWPANVVLDEDQAAALDKQSGWSKTPSKVTRGPDRNPSSFGLRTTAEEAACYGDSGGASRFFYVAKAPARERPKVDGVAHPTVKPLTLMRWLCRLVTPPGGVVLEPFAGSGTTIEAALMEGFRVVAIEREPDYLPLIAARLERVAQEPDDGQLTFDASA